MPLHFSPAPPNFDKFLQLTSSGSRTLSPENELRQMTVASTSDSKIRSGTFLDLPTSSGYVTSSTGLHKTSSNLMETKSSLKANLSSHGRNSFASQRYDSANMNAEVHQNCFKNDNFSVVEYQNDVKNDDMLEELIEGFKTFSLWQYGSPFYSPVMNRFYCWNLHPLHLKQKDEYGDMEGIACDFCGYTKWLQPNARHLEDHVLSISGKCEGCKIESTCTEIPPKTQQSNVKEQNSALELSELSIAFYHCSLCGVDICVACIADVYSDPRYHAPCLQCMVCRCFFSKHQAAAHHCKDFNSPPGATSVTREALKSPRRPNHASLRIKVGAHGEENYLLNINNVMRDQLKRQKHIRILADNDHFSKKKSKK